MGLNSSLPLYCQSFVLSAEISASLIVDAIVNAANDSLLPVGTVGPIWKGGNDGELALLASCYRRCLEIADANRIATIAFPSISTGIYDYPIELAANVAINSVRTTMASLPSVREVTFCCFSPNDLMVYQKYLVQA